MEEVQAAERALALAKAARVSMTTAQVEEEIARAAGSAEVGQRPSEAAGKVTTSWVCTMDMAPPWVQQAAAWLLCLPTVPAAA